MTSHNDRTADSCQFACVFNIYNVMATPSLVTKRLPDALVVRGALSAATPQFVGGPTRPAVLRAERNPIPAVPFKFEGTDSEAQEQCFLTVISGTKLTKHGCEGRLCVITWS